MCVFDSQSRSVRIVEEFVGELCSFQLLKTIISTCGRNRKDLYLQAYLFQLRLEQRDHVLLHHKVGLVQVLDDKVVVRPVKHDNDGLDRRLTCNKDTCHG